MTVTLFCLCFTCSVRRRLALLGSNQLRDNRTKEVSCDTSLEDFSSSRLFLFRQDTNPPSPPQDTFLPCLKKSRGLGQSPSRKTKIFFIFHFNSHRSKSPQAERSTGCDAVGRCNTRNSRRDCRGNQARPRIPSGTLPPVSQFATNVRP